VRDWDCMWCVESVWKICEKRKWEKKRKKKTEKKKKQNWIVHDNLGGVWFPGTYNKQCHIDCLDAIKRVK
jgi:hypothetical protein